MRRWNRDRRFDGIPKIKLQALEPSSPESLQSQTSLRSKNRLPLNDLGGSSRSTTSLIQVTAGADWSASVWLFRLHRIQNIGSYTVQLRLQVQVHDCGQTEVISFDQYQWYALRGRGLLITGRQDGISGLEIGRASCRERV